MTEEVTTEQATAAEPVSTTPTESLDSIAAEFQEATTSETRSESPAPQPEPKATAESESIPDPIRETDAFKKYLSGHSEDVKAIRADLRQTLDTLNSQVKANARAKEEKDIRGITGDLAKEIGEGTNEKLVEAALGLKYRDDKAFQKIWNNREQNPAAFKRAMSIVSNEIKGMFNRTVDPQVQENLRAMENSVNKSSNRTKEPQTVEERFAGNNFDTEWQKLIKEGGGNLI